MLVDVYNDLSKKMASHRFKALAEHLREHEMTLNQYSILSIIQHSGACLSIQLAQTLKLKAASITYLVDSLEKRELVKRVENPEDRRSQYIHLTDAGREIIYFTQNHEIVTKFFEQLNEDDTEILYIMMRMLNRKIQF